VPFLAQTGQPAIIPASMAILDESTSGLTAELLGGIDRIADEFLSVVEASAQIPSDPVYQELWQKAQQSSDDRMKALYGTHAWMKHHVEAHRQALPVAEPTGHSRPPAAEPE